MEIQVVSSPVLVWLNPTRSCLGPDRFFHSMFVVLFTKVRDFSVVFFFLLGPVVICIAMLI